MKDTDLVPTENAQQSFETLMQEMQWLMTYAKRKGLDVPEHIGQHANIVRTHLQQRSQTNGQIKEDS